jgi:hypothetical protein
MPNWCSNCATLTAKTPDQVDVLEKLVEAYDTNQPFLNILRPMPSHIYRGNLGEAERQKYGANNWYDWSVDNWGCKWDCDIASYERGDDSITVRFDSAWGPPVELYEYLVQNGWVIDATYYEPGVGFYGVFSDGKNNHYAGRPASFFETTVHGEMLDDEYNILEQREEMEMEEE